MKKRIIFLLANWLNVDLGPELIELRVTQSGLDAAMGLSSPRGLVLLDPWTRKALYLRPGCIAMRQELERTFCKPSQVA